MNRLRFLPSALCLSAVCGQLEGLMTRIRAVEMKIVRWHKTGQVSRRLETIPGVGPMTASEIAAIAGDPGQFHGGRQFAAWLGLAYDEDVGNLVHEISDGARFSVRSAPRRAAPGLRSRRLLRPAPRHRAGPVEPPPRNAGIWAWEGEAGPFWARSPSIPPVAFAPASPAGAATCEGDAADLHAANGAVTKFLADVRLVADFAGRTIGGAVNRFRSPKGVSLGTPQSPSARPAFSGTARPSRTTPPPPA